MSRVGRYIFSQALVGLVTGLTLLTLVVWITQALRDLDVVTAQGQALWMFLSLTALALPSIVVTLVPIALFIACFYTLYRLNADSELIVMAAAGMNVGQIARPFLLLAALTMAISASFSLYLAPESSRVLRHVVTEVRADVLSSVLQEGRFMPLEPNVTLHIEARDGQMLRGLFLEDRRVPANQTVYVADQARIVTLDETSYLMMTAGTIQQRGQTGADVTTIDFEEYAIDLSSLAQRDVELFYKARERSTFELLTADMSDPDFARDADKIRAELHERFTTPLYPLALVLIVLALAGRPRTNRQSRARGVLAGAGALVTLIGAQFAASSAAVAGPAGVVFVYLVPLAAIAIAGWAAFGGRSPAWLGRITRSLADGWDRMSQRAQRRAGQALS